MTLFIIATKVKQFKYYLRFTGNGFYGEYYLEGLINNATQFEEKRIAVTTMNSIVTDRELFIETTESANIEISKAS